MDNQKPLQFKGTAGGYFVVAIVTAISAYIPLFGWAFGFNYATGWYADSTLLNGKKIVYKAGYGETLVFLFINVLLTIITLGIYIFWFVPKSYRYIADHISYADQVPAAVAPPAATNIAQANNPVPPAPGISPTPQGPIGPPPQQPPTNPIQ